MSLVQIYSRTNWPLTNQAVGSWVDWVSDKGTVETFTVSNNNDAESTVELRISTGGTSFHHILPPTVIPPKTSVVLGIKSCVLLDDQRIQAKTSVNMVDFLASGSIYLVRGSGGDPIVDDGAEDYNRIPEEQSWLIDLAHASFDSRLREQKPTLERGYKANTNVTTEFKLEDDSYPTGMTAVPIWYQPDEGQPDDEVVNFWTELYFSIDGGEPSYKLLHGKDGSHMSLVETGSNRYQLVMVDTEGAELKSPSFDMAAGRPMCLYFTVAADYAIEAWIYEQEHSGNENPLRVQSMYWWVDSAYMEADIFRNPKLLVDYIGTDGPGFNWIAMRLTTWLTDNNFQLTDAHDEIAKAAFQLYDIYGSQAHVEFSDNHVADNWGDVSHDI